MQESSLRQHEKDRHNVERCKQCGKILERKKALKNHIWFNHKIRRKRGIKRRKKIFNPLDQYNKLSEEEKQKLREQIEAKAIIIGPAVYTDEERKDLLRDWRELGK